jgi:NADP-dependent 3-hydroxy acid dehydrogenase YdfG
MTNTHPMKLTHLCAVITGAARGIGFATASRLIREGARVVLADIDEATLNTALERLHSPLATAAIADVAKPQDCSNLVAIAQSSGMHLNLWINNAGLARHRPICEYSEHEIDLMLSVNLKGTILGSQAALRAMSANRAGHIINVISTASLRGIPTETVYCAAKWGARGFTQGLREEAAASGVRVTALLPGGVDTPFWKDAVSRQMPTQDFLTAEQVADSIVSLATMDPSIVPQELVLRAINDRDFAQS